MIVLDVLVFLFYVCWGGISLVAQMKDEFKEKIKKYDRLNLIPNYKFFCPKPVRYDYHLYYRIGREGDESGEWKEVSMGAKRNIFCFIWHPQKRYRKIFYKTVKMIRKSQRNGTKINRRWYASLMEHVRRVASVSQRQPVRIRITCGQDLRTGFEEKDIYTS